MNPTIKNVLGVAVILGVVLTGVAAVQYTNYFGESIPTSSLATFAVTGQGKATAVPDVAQFSFSVITEGGMDVAALQQKNTDAANKAIAFVKSKGVDAKDIKTQSYDVQPKYDNYVCPPIPYGVSSGVMQSSGPSTGASAGGVSNMMVPVRCSAPKISGYTITQSVQVKVRDFSKVGDIMSGIVAVGVNNVSQLQFTLDDPTSVQQQARADAMAKARQQAVAMAKAGGFTLGRLLSVDENSNSYPIYQYDAMSTGAGVSKAAPAPAIQPGSQDVNMTVTLRYEIK